MVAALRVVQAVAAAERVDLALLAVCCLSGYTFAVLKNLALCCQTPCGLGSSGRSMMEGFVEGAVDRTLFGFDDTASSQEMWSLAEEIWKFAAVGVEEGPVVGPLEPIWRDSGRDCVAGV